MEFPNDVEFELVREPWNVYKLDDGAKLKVRLILVKIFTPPGVKFENTEGLQFAANPMFVTYVPQDMKGTPSDKPISSEERIASIVEDVDFETVNEEWNEYKLPKNFRLRLKMIITQIGKTDKFSGDGSPLYNIGHQMVHRIVLPKGFRKKKKKTKTKKKKKSLAVV